MFSVAPGTKGHCVPGTSCPGSLHHSAALSVDSLIQNHATPPTRRKMGGPRITNVEARFAGDIHYRSAAKYFTRASNSTSNSSAAVDECEAGCPVCSILVESPRASSTIAGSVAGSSDLKSGSTLELLIRCESGSRHLEEYGSPKNSSSERKAGSEFSTRSL